MSIRVYRVPTDDAARSVARRITAPGILGQAGTRHFAAYVTVTSDRTDVDTLVHALEPQAVPVDLTHLPNPVGGDIPLF